MIARASITTARSLAKLNPSQPILAASCVRVFGLGLGSSLATRLAHATSAPISRPATDGCNVNLSTRRLVELCVYTIQHMLQASSLQLLLHFALRGHEMQATS